MSDLQKSEMISERVEFLSQFAAQNYLVLYDQSFATCLSKVEPTRENGGKCMDQAIAAVRTQAQLTDYDAYIVNRLVKLRDGGFLTPFLKPSPGPTFGILGDSLPAGAVADLRLEANLVELIYDLFIDLPLLENTAKPLAGKRLQSAEFAALKNARSLQPLVRVFDTPENHKTGLGRKYENLGSAYVDCNECAFPYLLARDLGFPAANIYLAAQDGVRVGDIHKQMQRLALPLGHLPDYIVVSFTGNDICNNENLVVSGQKKTDDYQREMTEQLIQSLREFKPSPAGTHIMVVAAADVVNLLTNQSVLDKVVTYSVPFQNIPAQVTCRDIRKQRVPLAAKLTSMCNLILQTDPDDPVRVAKVKELHSAVVAAQRQAVEQTQRWITSHGLSSQFAIEFADEILAAQYNADDIANECFHPSIRGHEKIALELKAHFQRWIGGN